MIGLNWKEPKIYCRFKAEWTFEGVKNRKPTRDLCRVERDIAC